MHTGLGVCRVHRTDSGVRSAPFLDRRWRFPTCGTGQRRKKFKVVPLTLACSVWSPAVGGFFVVVVVVVVVVVMVFVLQYNELSCGAGNPCFGIAPI